LSKFTAFGPLATTAPYGAETSFFSRNREPRIQCTAPIDGALFSLYVSTVHLTRGFRAKRASGGVRRAPAPVQLRGGIRSISAWSRRHMAPASLRRAECRGRVPTGLPVREECRAPCRALCPRAIAVIPPVRSRVFLGCPNKPESLTHIAAWETRHRDLRERRTHYLYFFLNYP